MSAGGENGCLRADGAPGSPAKGPSAFLAEPTDEALERICDAHWNGGGDGVRFLDIHQHDACNHTLSGVIEIDGVEHGFIIENGNRNGTEVRAWGDPEDVGTYTPPPPPEPLTFIPKDDALFATRPQMFAVYVYWRKQPWFAEKERAYAYDRHFQPGGFVENHYREWADKRGLKVGLLSSLPSDALAAVTKAEGSSEGLPAREAGRTTPLK
jgi:hypothetical protein